MTPSLADDVPVRGAPVRGRVLIVKLGSIGDVVMAIPGAAQMHAAGYAVHWVVSEAIAPVLALYPWIHVMAVDERRLLRSSPLERARAFPALWARLRKEATGTGPWELIATLYYDPRYRLLTLPLRAKRRVALSRTDRRFELLPGRHHADEYARILCGAEDIERATQLAPVPVANLPLPARARQEGRPRVVLVPAGARNVLRDDALRRWPVEAYVTLASTLLAQGCEVLLCGGPDDRWASPHFRELAGRAGEDSFADLIGQLSLVETLALMDSADVTVTHDTGPLHLAGLTRTGIVTIFGPTDPHGRLPRRANAVALWGGEGFACRPCYDGRDYAPCPHNGCMRQVTPGQVLAEVLQLMEARRSGRELPPVVRTPEPTASVLVSIGGGR